MNDLSRLQLDKISTTQIFKQEGAAAPTRPRDTDDISKSSHDKTSINNSQSSSVPKLSAPDNTSTAQGSSQFPQTGTASAENSLSQIEQQMFTLLETELLETLVQENADKPDAQKTASQMAQNALTQHMQTHGSLPESARAQAFASVCEDLLRKAQGKKPGIDDKLGPIRAKSAAATNPEIEVLEELLRQTNANEGQSPEKAARNAANDALASISRNMPNIPYDEDNPILSKIALTSAALELAIAEQLGSSSISKAYGKGVVEGLQLGNMALQFLQYASKITATPEAAKANRSRLLSTVQGALKTMSDTMEEAKQVLLAFPEPAAAGTHHGGRKSSAGGVSNDSDDSQAIEEQQIKDQELEDEEEQQRVQEDAAKSSEKTAVSQDGKTEGKGSGADSFTPGVKDSGKSDHVQHKGKSGDDTVHGKDSKGGSVNEKDGAGDNDGITANIPGFDLSQFGFNKAGVPQTTLQFMAFITAVISALQTMLATMAESDMQQDSLIEKAQQDATKNQYDKTMAQLKQQMNQAIEANSPLMRFLKIFISIFAFGIALVLTIPTGGASWGEFLMAIAVMVAIQVATQVLSSTGALQKLFTDIGDAIDKALGKKAPAWLQDLVKVLVMAVIIAAVALAGGEAAGQVTSAFVQATIKTAVLQTTILLVQSSGIVTDAVAGIASAANASQKATQISEDVANVIASLVMAGISFKLSTDILGDVPQNMESEDTEAGQELKQQIEKFVAQMKQAAKVLQVTTSTLQATDSVLSGVSTMQEAENEKKIAEIQKMVAIIKAIIEILQEMLQNLQGPSGSQGLVQLQADLSSLFTNIIKSNEQTVQSLMAATQGSGA